MFKNQRYIAEAPSTNKGSWNSEKNDEYLTWQAFWANLKQIYYLHSTLTTVHTIFYTHVLLTFTTSLRNHASKNYQKP